MPETDTDHAIALAMQAIDHPDFARKAEVQGV
jgi:hypothetical protein